MEPFSTPFSAQAKSRCSVFLCSQTSRKRLLRWLFHRYCTEVPRSINGLLKMANIFAVVVVVVVNMMMIRNVMYLFWH